MQLLKLLLPLLLLPVAEMPLLKLLLLLLPEMPVMQLLLPMLLQPDPQAFDPSSQTYASSAPKQVLVPSFAPELTHLEPGHRYRFAQGRFCSNRRSRSRSNTPLSLVPGWLVRQAAVALSTLVVVRTAQGQETS